VPHCVHVVKVVHSDTLCSQYWVVICAGGSMGNKQQSAKKTGKKSKRTKAHRVMTSTDRKLSSLHS